MNKRNKRKILQFIVALYCVLNINTVFSEAEEIDKENGSATVSVIVSEDNTSTEENISPSPHAKTNFGVKGVSNFIFDGVKLGETSNAVISGETAEGKEIDTLGVEVVDLRGSGSGWVLKATLSSLELKDDPERRILEGFKLRIPTLEVTSKSSSLANDRVPKAKEIIFVGKEEKTIFTAEKGQGMGKYTNVFSRKEQTVKKKVTLEVPLIAKKGEYEGKITWTLIDGPN